MKATLLETRVGRRMLALFVLCALAPIGVLAAVTFWRVGGELRGHARARLEQASKGVALLLFKRLRDLDAELGALAPHLRQQRAPAAAGAALSPRLGEALAGLALQHAAGPPVPLLGRPAPLPPLPEGGTAHLATGRPLLVMEPAGRIWVVSALDAGAPSRAVLWAEPRPEYLWDTASGEAPLAVDMRVCVFQASGVVLHCTLAGTPPPGGPRAVQPTAGTSGFFEWAGEDGPQLAAWWALFLRYEFAAPELLVLVSEPKARALGAVAKLRQGLLPVFLLTLWFVLLLSYVQIRRTTDPLSKLEAGTRRLAALDFSSDVAVRSGDEFEQLAASFNTMADRLRREFEQGARLTSTLRDTTASLRESEGRLRTILETAADGIVTTDGEGRIESFNGTAERMFGYARDEVVGRTVGLLLSPSAAAPEAGAVVAFRTGELFGRRRDGSLFPVELAVSRARLGEREILTGFVRDIAARKQAEEERQRLEAQLRQAQKMETIGTLAGGIAHDFNNILTAVGGYLDLAMAAVPRDSETFNDLEQVRRAADRARGLVRQILLFSRKGQQKTEPVDPASLVEEARGLLRAALPSTIEITVATDPDTPIVLADPTQLHQVIMNLGTNAYHAMRERGGTLSIALGRARLPAGGGDTPPVDLPPGDYARFTVRDTGHGMDRATMDRMFEPFFTTKPVGEGTGLGLSVVHGIVTSHGGAIAVESEPGRGTTFTILIPAAGDEKATEREPADAMALEGSGRVLVVDDDPVIARMAEKALNRLGYAVTARTNSGEALRLFREDPRRFDVVITDYTMPGMTGVELAAELRRLRPDLPMVLATGLGDPIAADRLQETGFRAYLAKPVSVRELAEAVQRALHPPHEDPA